MAARSRKDDAKAPKAKGGKVAKVGGRGGARPGAGRPKTITNGASAPFALRVPGWVSDLIREGGPDAVAEIRKLIVRWAEKRRPKA